MCKSVTLPLKLNMSSESIRMDCSFGPRLGLIFLAFHFICVALSFLFCPCRLFFYLTIHLAAACLTLCVQKQVNVVCPREREPEREGESGDETWVFT